MASASSIFSVPAPPQPVRMPLDGDAAGKNQNHIFAEAGDLRFDLRLGAVADADHGDDRADADDDAERGQHGTHFVPAQRAVSNVKCGSDAHFLR